MVRTIPIPVKVPSGLTGFPGYSGVQPARFGFPFAEGELPVGAGVVVVDSAGEPIAADVRWTATWHPPDWVGVNSVRWLLVTMLAPLRRGVADQPFLRYGPEVSGGAAVLPAQPMPVAAAADLTFSVGAATLSVGPAAGLLGDFVLSTWFDGVQTDIPLDAPASVVVESTGVCTVVRADSNYGGPTGHESTTRFYFYSGCPFVRVVHTVVWNHDASIEIVGMKFSRAVADATGATYGFAPSVGSYDTTNKASAKQIDWNQVRWEDSSTVEGQLDGWLNVASSSTPLFIGLVDCAHKFPAGFAYAAGVASVLFIAPESGTRMSFAPLAIAAAPVVAALPDPSTWETNLPWGGGTNTSSDPAKRSPRGTGFTWEFTLWFGDAAVTPAMKSALVQKPVTAVVDPGHAALADISTPMRAYSTDSFPELEVAFDRIIDFASKSTHADSERALDGLLGWINFGNFPWQFDAEGVGQEGEGYYTPRYLMNHGEGAALLFWLRALRTGDPAHLRWAMANARCLSDKLTCHVREWGQYADDADKPHAADWKMRGGQYAYNAYPFGNGPHGSAGPSMTLDSEYLLLGYYMTGDERLRDVIRERILATKYARWGTTGLSYYPHTSAIVGAGRDLYNMLRETCDLARYAWDDTDPTIAGFAATLRQWASDTLDTVLFAQNEMFAEHGAYWFPGITSSHYIVHALIAANRVFASADALTALARWEDYLGRPDAPGFNGQVLGPMSIWSLAEQQRSSPTDGRAAVIDGVLRVRAETLLRDGAFYGHDFEGMGPNYDFTIGAQLREILAGKWALERHAGPSPTERFAISYVSAQLFVSGTTWRHVVFINKPSTAALDLAVHLNGYNSGALVGSEIPVSIKLWKPDLSSSTSSFSYLATFFHTWGLEAQVVSLAGGSAAGVYALEVKTTAPLSRGLPVHVSPSGACQVAHYVALGIGVHSVSMQAPAAAAEVWLKPEASATVRVVPVDALAGRTVLLDAAGAQLDTSQIDHVTGGTPIYEELSYVAGATPGLVRLVAGQVSPTAAFQLAGVRPYVAPTQADWFDPNALNPALVTALSLPNA